MQQLNIASWCAADVIIILANIFLFTQCEKLSILQLAYKWVFTVNKIVDSKLQDQEMCFLSSEL